MFDIADGVRILDGSPFSYTVNYTINSLPGVIILYKTEEISATASCTNGTCEYYDDQVSSSISPLSSDDSNITVTVTVSGIKIIVSYNIIIINIR